MLTTIAYAILRPVMRFLHFRTDLRMQQLPHPVDAPHAHATGVDPDRVLLFGSGPAIGYGVLSNELALPGHLARQLSAITGRGVDIDVVADTGVTIEGSIALLRELKLWRYDAILLTIGVNNALLLTSVAVWRDAVTELLRFVEATAPKRTRVLVVAVPPIRSMDSHTMVTGWIADRHAAALNRETRRILQNYERMTYVPFSPLARADQVRYLSTSTYERWASMIVVPLSQQLMAEPRAAERAPDDDEQPRQAAVEAAGVLDTPSEERFNRITTLATQLLDAEFAIVLFVDNDRQWIKGSTHVDSLETRRDGAFGSLTVAAGGLLVIADARLDPRVADNPYVVGEPRLVFYAGYPIESASGERIGVLSVYDRHTRNWTDGDTEILRDLALMAQRELIDDQRGPE